jgi:two-component system, LuxR family, response regulator FixJ
LRQIKNLEASLCFLLGMNLRQSDPAPKPLIVIVDDDAAVRHSLNFALELEGYAVRTYANGDELLWSAYLIRPDCLLIDYKLTDMTAFDLLRMLREKKIDSPAILMTSHPSIHVCEQAIRYAIPIIEKPFFGSLLDRLREAVPATNLCC